MPPRIPGVELGEVIGRGGNAVVYSGVQTSVRLPVAVKVESRAISQDRNRRRFLREASATGRISAHPHVVSLIDVGTTEDDHPYLVMELCEGGSVSELLKRNGPLPAVDAVDIGIAITGALAAAHEAGILHRDIKPGNILIDGYGTPRLSDFGLAATLTTDEAFSATVEALTPAYAAPEVFGREVPTVRSDVYAMGATIYAMLVGGAPRRRPDGSSPSIAELFAALPEALPAPDAPGAELVMSVLWRATAYQAADRYPTAADLRAALIDVRERLGPATGRVGGPEVTVVGLGEVGLPRGGAPTGAPSGGPSGSASGGPSGTASDGPSAGSGTGAAAASSTPAVASAPMGAAAAPEPRRRRRGWLIALAAFLVGALLGSGVTFAVMQSRASGPTRTESGTTPGTFGTSEPSDGTDGADGSDGTDGEDGTAAQSASGDGASGTNQSGSADAANLAPAPDLGTCWGGMVTTPTNVSAAQVPCDTEHYWETFASGELSTSSQDAYPSTVAADPTVQDTCTQEALAEYLGSDDLTGLTLDVIPPTEAQYLAGARWFACVASPEGGPTTTSLHDG